MPWFISPGCENPHVHQGTAALLAPYAKAAQIADIGPLGFEYFKKKDLL